MKVRITHPWYKWECYKDGFYEINTKIPREDAEKIYMNYFYAKKFKRDIKKLIKLWSHSCEHFLTNPNMNRVAWLGQACVFITTGVTPNYKYSYNQLPLDIRAYNNKIAKDAINEFQKKQDKRLYQQMEMHGVFL